MKSVSVMTRIKKSVCILCAAVFALAFCACGKDKKTSAADSNPYALSDTGKLTDQGYELPYEYADGYTAVVPVVGKCEYMTANKTPGGNMTFHLTTDRSEEEVRQFYEAYFSQLQKVKAKKTTDSSVGYFDKDKRLILFNLNVWTADGKTNFQLGAEACDKLEDSIIFEAAQ